MTSSQAPLSREILKKIAAKKMTWAEALGITRTEAWGMVTEAHRLFEFGQHDRARTIMEGLIVVQPNVGYFHALLGGMWGRMGKEDKALACYNEALKLDPKDLTARVNRGDLLLRKGQLDKALEDLVAATKLDPTAKTDLGKRARSLARMTAAAVRELIGKSGQGAGPRPKR